MEVMRCCVVEISCGDSVKIKEFGGVVVSTGSLPLKGLRCERFPECCSTVDELIWR